MEDIGYASSTSLNLLGRLSIIPLVMVLLLLIWIIIIIRILVWFLIRFLIWFLVWCLIWRLVRRLRRRLIRRLGRWQVGVVELITTRFALAMVNTHARRRLVRLPRPGPINRLPYRLLFSRRPLRLSCLPFLFRGLHGLLAGSWPILPFPR